MLKAEYLQATGATTLRPVLPTRATDDIDLFLTADVVVSPDRMRALRKALDSLGFEPAPGAEHYQFVRDIDYQGQQRVVKIDLLAQVPEDTKHVTMDERRIRPHGFRRLHGHPAPEALTVHAGLVSLPVCGTEEDVSVQLPHPFSYLLLKLYALKDRKDDPDEDYGRHHA